jgi:hypothetical protein
MTYGWNQNPRRRTSFFGGIFVTISSPEPLENAIGVVII